MAPFGGRTRFLGTNPVAIGIPAGEERSADLRCLDQRRRARQDHRRRPHRASRFPKDGPIDPDGHPTTDAEQALAGAVLPFGGPKGSAISFIIDIFCGVLTGAAFASHLNTLEDLATVQNVGHVLAAVRTDLFVPDGRVQGSGWTPSCGCSRPRLRRPGIERVLVPGEIELAHEARAATHGIPLAAGDRRAAGRASARSSACRFPPPLAGVRRPESARS